MANTTSRILALGTVAAVSAVAVASGVFALKLTPDSVNTEYGYGYVDGYGYGYGYGPKSTGTTGTTGAGGGVGGTATTTTPTSNGPKVTLFPNFNGACGQAATSLNDAGVVAYYDTLNIINRVNADTRNLTRAEFLKLTLNAAGVNVTSEAAPTYSDVSASHTLANYIAYATRMNIVSGQNNMFRPNDAISRGEAMKILVNSTKLTLASASTTFADVPASYSLALFVQTAKDNCIVNGVTPIRFEPLRGITVAETAKVLYNMAHTK